MPSQACQKSVVRGLICHTGKHATLLAALDLPERIAAELEVVTLLIDRETAVAFDQNAVVDSGNQVVEVTPSQGRARATRWAFAGRARWTTNPHSSSRAIRSRRSDEPDREWFDSA